MNTEYCWINPLWIHLCSKTCLEERWTVLERDVFFRVGLLQLATFQMCDVVYKIRVLCSIFIRTEVMHEPWFRTRCCSADFSAAFWMVKAEGCSKWMSRGLGGRAEHWHWLYKLHFCQQHHSQPGYLVIDRYMTFKTREDCHLLCNFPLFIPASDSVVVLEMECGIASRTHLLLFLIVSNI